MAANQGLVAIRGTGDAVGTPVAYLMYGSDGTTALDTGYVRTTSGIQITHSASSDTIVSGDGEIVGMGAWGETIEGTFTLVPTGTTLAAARLNAKLPPLGSTVTISGADVIIVGSFTDAINTATDGKKWVYLGGGSLSFTATGQASMTLPLKRSFSIAGGAIIAS